MARPTKAPGYGSVRLRKDRRTSYWYARFTYRGKRETVKLTGPDGKKPITSQRVAERQAREIDEDLEQGRYLRVKNRNVTKSETFADLVDEFKKKKYPSTRRRGGYWGETTIAQNASTLNILVREFGEFGIGDIDVESIEAYIARMRDDGLALASRNRHLAILKLLFEKAREWGYVSYSVASEVKTEKGGEKKPRPYRPEELAVLLPALEARHRAIATVYLETGLRRSELMSLIWADVDLAGRTLIVRDSKNRDDREVPLSNAVHAILVERRREWEQESRRDQSVDPRLYGTLADIRQVLDRAMKRLNREDPSLFDPARRAWLNPIHSFRDTYGTRLRAQNVDLDTRAELMGHRDLKMTQAYGEAGSNAKRDAIERTFNREVGP